MSHLRDAWCAGHYGQVAVKDGPVNALSVACPTCGQPRGRDCIDLTRNARLHDLEYVPHVNVLYDGHVSRRQAAERARG